MLKRDFEGREKSEEIVTRGAGLFKDKLAAPQVEHLIVSGQA